MEYIILDLEWDSVYFKPEKRFINQILQIGAVKLNEHFETVDTFSRTICSEISKKVTTRFAELTGITTEMMRAGVPFSQAVEEYNKFAENADITMTWSNSDLYSIIENEEHLLKNGIRFKMRKYLDLQKLVQGKLRENGYESKNQISLEGAAELMDISTAEFALHTAVDDCKVCALLLKKCYDKQRFDILLRDTSAPDFHKRLKFKPYPISDINDKAIQSAHLEFKCPECNGKTVRMAPFRYRNRWFMANFKCKNCGFKFNGRVSFKKTFDDVLVKRKVCEFKPKKRKNNDMQSMPEKLSGTPN